MPSRCIFFLSALRAWSTLLSRTRTCKRSVPSGSCARPSRGWIGFVDEELGTGKRVPLGGGRILAGRGDLPERLEKVHRWWRERSYFTGGPPRQAVAQGQSNPQGPQPASVMLKAA